MYDLIIVGAGLSGIFAGALAARRGASVLVIARGHGGTHTGAGCLGVLGYDDDGKPLARWDQEWPRAAREQHPYARISKTVLDQALAEFIQICEQGDYHLSYRPGENFLLPTAAGATRACAVVPVTMAAGDLRRMGDLALADLAGLRDFCPALAAANLSLNPGIRAHSLPLPLPDTPSRRNACATDLALLFDQANYRAKVSKLWRPALAGVKRLGLPAVLGLGHAPAVHRDLSDRLGVEIFEIPILPPSAPGMRLFNVLRGALRASGGELILGPRVVGRIDKRSAARRVAGVTAETAGGQRTFDADAVILASGGFLHGGLQARQDGKVVESVFNFPVACAPRILGPDRAAWTRSLYLDSHPYARFGLRVDDDLRPVDAHGERLYENLYAIGGVLAGADRIAEGSREGIGIGTAWKAVNSLRLEIGE